MSFSQYIFTQRKLVSTSIVSLTPIYNHHTATHTIKYSYTELLSTTDTCKTLLIKDAYTYETLRELHTTHTQYFTTCHITNHVMVTETGYSTIRSVHRYRWNGVVGYLPRLLLVVGLVEDVVGVLHQPALGVFLHRRIVASQTTAVLYTYHRYSTLCKKRERCCV